MLSVKEFGGQNKMFNNLTFYTDGASRQTKISQGNISACCRGERLSAGKTSDNKKLHWAYLNEEG